MAMTMAPSAFFVPCYVYFECGVTSRIHEGDLPGDAKLSVVEVLLYGWVSTALRLEGGKQRWLLHGIVGYLLTQFAAEFRGEEEKQHRLWRAMQRAVSVWLRFEASQKRLTTRGQCCT